MALHWSGVGAAPLMIPRQDETSEPISYAGWMADPYRVEDAMRGRNDDLVTSGIRAKVYNIALDGSQKGNGLIQMVDDRRCMLDARKSNGLILDGVYRNKDKSFEGCCSPVRMTMHEVMHEMVVGECHEPNSEGSGAWMAYMNARIAGLFLLVLLEYRNGKSVVRATSRDSIWHYTGRELGPLP
ncbi:hypothetical protein Tco_0601962 [Tanacetum coccineum]